VTDSAGQKLAYVYFEDPAGATLGSEAAHPRRGAVDCREHRQAAGATTQVSRSVIYLNERGRFLLGRAG
jgi:hypothetical protein